MEKAKTNNEIKWLLLDQMADLKDKPISLVEAQILLDTITGENNSKVQEFYDWIWLDGEPCIVTALYQLIDYLKTLPGGDLARF